MPRSSLFAIHPNIHKTNQCQVMSTKSSSKVFLRNLFRRKPRRLEEREAARVKDGFRSLIEKDPPDSALKEEKQCLTAEEGPLRCVSESDLIDSQSSLEPVLPRAATSWRIELREPPGASRLALGTSLPSPGSTPEIIQSPASRSTLPSPPAKQSSSNKPSREKKKSSLKPPSADFNASRRQSRRAASSPMCQSLYIQSEMATASSLVRLAEDLWRKEEEWFSPSSASMARLARSTM